MFGGWESFGGAFNRPDWGQTMIGQLLPTEDVINTYVLKPAGRLFLIIDKPDHEFMRSLPWDREQPFMTNYEHNIVVAKPGSTGLAPLGSTHFQNQPRGDRRRRQSLRRHGRDHRPRLGARPGSHHVCSGSNVEVRHRFREQPDDLPRQEAGSPGLTARPQS